MTDGLDVLEIVGLRVPCVVGIHPEERKGPQDLVITLRLHLDVAEAARTTVLQHTVDYARVAGELTFILQLGRFLLIESAATALALAVLHGQHQVRVVDVIVEKPAALGGNGHPRLHITRQRASLALSSSSSPLSARGVDAVLLQTAGGRDDRSLHRLCLFAGGTVALPSGSTAWAVDDGRVGAVTKDVGVLHAGASPRHYVVASEVPEPEAGA